jgi:hypothetical protein
VLHREFRANLIYIKALVSKQNNTTIRKCLVAIIIMETVIYWVHIVLRYCAQYFMVFSHLDPQQVCIGVTLSPSRWKPSLEKLSNSLQAAQLVSSTSDSNVGLWFLTYSSALCSTM